MNLKAAGFLALVLPAILASAIAVLPSVAGAGYVPGTYHASSVSYLPGNAIEQKDGRVTPLTATRLADTHSDVCLANYKQCMTGCDGATSCSNQCKVNYDGCMSQQP